MIKMYLAERGALYSISEFIVEKQAFEPYKVKLADLKILHCWCAHFSFHFLINVACEKWKIGGHVTLSVLKQKIWDQASVAYFCQYNHHLRPQCHLIQPPCT